MPLVTQIRRNVSQIEVTSKSSVRITVNLVQSWGVLPLRKGHPLVKSGECAWGHITRIAACGSHSYELVRKSYESCTELYLRPM